MSTMPRSEESIFAEALQQPSTRDRAAFLDAACGGDAALRACVENLLKSHEEAGSFLRKPLAAPATVDQLLVERPGTVIGPYKLMEQIGEGGMGLVFVAEQLAPVRRKVALKVIKPGMDTREIIARFEAERQALALMDHPHIAKVLDAGATDSGRPYFVMELVKGIPLTDYCDQSQLTPRERLGLFVSVCQAVQHAHTKGVIHRDLKPSNILVTLHDGTPVVKVIDFGVAKAVGQHLTEKTIYTRFSQMIGTPLYMSPEQAEMSGLDIDTRSDIYSLAVLLYELLTGTTPFDSERLMQAAFDEIRRIIREEEPPRPSTRLSTLGATLSAVSAKRKMEPAKLSALVRGDLDWIAMKGLEKDRTRRYETASAFAADVQRYLREEPIEARPPSASYRLRKFVKRNRRVVIAGAVVLLTLVAGIVGTTWGMLEALGQRDETELARKDEAEQRLLALANAKKARENEGIAQKQRDEARTAREHLRRSLYASSMNLIPAAWEANNITRVLELLEETRPGKDEEDLRNFEWHYWNRLCHADLRTLQFGTMTRQNAQFSPDGTRYAALLVGDNQPSVVKVWDVAKGQELIALPLDHQHLSLAFLSFSRDGKRLALAGIDAADRSVPITELKNGRLLIWEVATGKKLLAKTGAFGVAALSPDGGRVVTNRQVWEVATDKVVAVLDADGIPFTFGGIQATFSPDGSRLVGAGPHGIWVWDAATGNIQIKMKAAKFSQPFAASFSPDGTHLAATGSSSGLQTKAKGEMVQGWVFDAFTGEKLVTVQAPPGTPASNLVGLERLVFSPDGQRLAGWFTSESSVLRIFDARTGAIRLTLKGHSGAIDAVTFSPDNTRLYSADRKGAVKVWDVTGDDGEPEQPFGDLTTIVISPDGSRAAEFVRGGLSRDKGVPRLEVVIRDSAGNQMQCFTGHAAAILSLRFSPDGRYVVSYAKDGEQKIWDADKGKVLLQQKWPTGPDDFYDPMTIDLYSYRPLSSGPGKFPGGRFFMDVPLGAQPVFSSDGSRLAAGVPDGGLKVWDLANFKEVYDFKRNVEFLHLSRDSCRVSLDEDGAWRLWDVAAGKKIDFVTGGKGWLGHKIISPDGNRMAFVRYPEVEDAVKLPVDKLMAFRGNRVQVWDTRTGALVATLTSNVPLGGPQTTQDLSSSLAFSPDGTRLAAISRPFPQAAGEILFWDIATGQELFRLKGHSTRVAGLVFGPGGKRIATIAAGEVKLWDGATGKELLSLKVRDRFTPSDPRLSAVELFFSRDGTRLFLQNKFNFSGPFASARPLVWDATPLPEKR
jgi:serine/threonine protein kinase/WD40 repeat protein